MEKVELTYEQKKELAEWIADRNFGAVTGSIMLRERGVELGREPNDIDIVVEECIDPDDIDLPPLVYDKQTKVGEDGYTVLARCWFFGTKIEFISDDIALKHSTSEGLKTKYCAVEDLLKAKKNYIELDDHAEYVEKSKQDIRIIEEYQKQFPIIRYKVSNNGYLEKMVSESKAGDKFIFTPISMMDFNEQEEWKIKDVDITSFRNPWPFYKKVLLTEEEVSSKLYANFEEAKRISMERWNNNSKQK